MKKSIILILILFINNILYSQNIKLKCMNDEAYFGGDEIVNPLGLIATINIDNTIKYKVENLTDETYAFFIDDSYFRFFADEQYEEEEYGIYNDYFRLKFSIEKDSKEVEYFAGTYRPDDSFNLMNQFLEKDSLILKTYPKEIEKGKRDSLMISHFLENHFFILRPGEVRYLKTDISLPEYYSDENTSAMTFFLKPNEQYEIKLRYVQRKEKVLRFLPKRLIEYFDKENIKIFEGELISEKIPLLYVKTDRVVLEE